MRMGLERCKNFCMVNEDLLIGKSLWISDISRSHGLG